ncbi:ALDH-like protein [Trichoderma cornu-damae]|uniref:ALDH-like protein n=1 Tax=Trichoderma cornu-damae TaxID=654480 RepID=A0A9P8TYG4_9HYPO|nr:ALDH-like protein [Trichoderma cornu-damae]
MSRYTVRQGNQEVVPLWINGEAAPLNHERIYEVVNAAEDKIVHYGQGGSVDDAKAACDAAAAAFPSWSKTPYWKRREILLKVADLIESRAADIGAMQCLETSSTVNYGQFLPKTCAPIIREVASQISTALSGSIPPSYDDQTHVFIHKEPVGVVLLIAPWNSPSILGPRSIAAALAAGCTVVLKASEICPLVYRMLVGIFEEAGVPKGALNQIQARREDAASVSEALIAHPAVRKVEFIGSASVGKIIGQLTSKYIKPVLMELGGKTPALVLRDADLKNAAKNIAFGAFCHHGQICFSTERIIVVREVADEFIRILKDEIATNYSNGLGSAATKHFALQSQAIVEDARKNGAEFIIGNNSLIGPNQTTLTPTILTGVPRSCRLADTESFGPSASLFVVDDADAAVAMANDTQYGLTAALWTDNVMLGLDISAKLQYGIVHINACTLADMPMMPVQGRKSSGWGSNNASYGINEFLEMKTVTLRPSSSETQFRG